MMQPKTAICYTASPGYAYETLASSLLAEDNLDGNADAAVFVFLIGDNYEEEFETVQRVLESTSVQCPQVASSHLDGFAPKFGRLFLDRFLPQSVEKILYLDGDTQVVQPLQQLLNAPIPADGLCAVRDPMVFIRRVHARLAGKIDDWFEKADLSETDIDDYINSGVFLINRDTLVRVRREVVAYAESRETRFRDQDAINHAVRGRINHVSMSWNFPGFMLGGKVAEIVDPSIVHFMSDPRPWEGQFEPWGAEFSAVYDSLDRENPGLAQFRGKLSRRALFRYKMQQRVKATTEYRTFNSERAIEKIRELESATVA